MSKKNINGLGIRLAISRARAEREQRIKSTIDKAARELIRAMKLTRKVSRATNKGVSNIHWHDDYLRGLEIDGIRIFTEENHSRILKIYDSIPEDGVVLGLILEKFDSLLADEGISSRWDIKNSSIGGRTKLLCSLYLSW